MNEYNLLDDEEYGFFAWRGKNWSACGNLDKFDLEGKTFLVNLIIKDMMVYLNFCKLENFRSIFNPIPLNSVSSSRYDPRKYENKNYWCPNGCGKKIVCRGGYNFYSCSVCNGTFIKKGKEMIVKSMEVVKKC